MKQPALLSQVPPGSSGFDYSSKNVSTSGSESPVVTLLPLETDSKMGAELLLLC
jgi:hypothetical protein